MLKWVGIAVVVAFISAIAFGYRGGAKEATGNYQSVMRR